MGGQPIHAVAEWERRYDAHPAVLAMRAQQRKAKRPTERQRARWRGLLARALAELGPRP